MAKNLKKAPNSNTLKAIAEAGKASANSKATVDIDIELLDENPDNSRIFNMENIDGLMKTIKEEGFSGAIEVYKKEDGRYEISSGHRRVRAAKKLGFKTVPAIVTIKPDEITTRIRLLSSNIHNRDLSALDKARAMDYYAETLKLAGNKKYSNRELNIKVAEFFNTSDSTVRRYRYLIGLIDPLKELLESKVISYKDMYQIGGCREDIQREFLEKIQSFDLVDGEYPASRVKDSAARFFEKNNEDSKKVQKRNFSDLQSESLIQEELVSDDVDFSFADMTALDDVINKAVEENVSNSNPSTEHPSTSDDSLYDNFVLFLDDYAENKIKTLNAKKKKELKKKLERIIAML